MTYGVLLSGSERSAAATRSVDPFTQKEIQAFTPRMTPEDIESAMQVLARHAAEDLGDRWHSVRFSDGGRIDIEVDESGAPAWGVNIRAFTTGATSFLYDLMSAGNFVILTSTPHVVTSIVAEQRLSAGELAMAASADDLHRFLQPDAASA